MENIPDRFLAIIPCPGRTTDAEWGRGISREAHDFKVVGSNPASAISWKGEVARNSDGREGGSSLGISVGTPECAGSSPAVLHSAEGAV